MRRSVKWELSTCAALVFALLYFFDGSGIISAAVPAAAAHELGHLLLLRLYGRPLRSVRIGLFGMELDYAGALDGAEAALCAFAGPLFGAVYALAACTLGGAFLELSGALSFAFSVFNLLPILPLDGGRIVEALAGARPGCILSRVFAVILFAAGVTAAIRFRFPAPLMMSVWLLLRNFRR